MESGTINLNNITLRISAGNKGQIPLDLPHIIFSGRSNVGKSTLINKLLMRNKLARTSSLPGKTVTINFFEIDKKLFFVDLPGYGYANRSASDKAKWSALVEDYFKTVKDVKAFVVQLVDLKVGPTGDDIMMLEYMSRLRLSYIVAATKSDKLNVTDKTKATERLLNHNLIGEERLFVTSANGKNSIDRLRNAIFNDFALTFNAQN